MVPSKLDAAGDAAQRAWRLGIMVSMKYLETI
jgi:hypothetical protein